jgi:hypothetical protein
MKRAGELLSGFFDGEVLKKAQGYHDLFSSWTGIAGSTIAAHSRISELEKEVLLVEADHPGWIQILQTKQKVLLDTVRRRFPDLVITGISFRLCRDPSEMAVISDVLPVENSEEDHFSGEADQSQDYELEKSNSGESNLRNKYLYEKISDEAMKKRLKSLEQSIRLKTKDKP